jgi:hypothetical protein
MAETVLPDAGHSQPQDAVSCNEFDADVAVVGRLGVHSRCASFTPSSPSLYVNGDVHADGVANVDALRFNVQGKPLNLGFSASGEADQQVGLNASLRIASALGLGTDQREDVSRAARLIVTADTAGSPLQLWRAAARTLAIVDSSGRLGVGTAEPTANIGIQSSFIKELGGTLSGRANRPEVHGNQQTEFDTDLRDGDYIRLEAAGHDLFKVTVKGPHDLLIDPPATQDFHDATAFGAESPLDIRAATGDELLSVDRWGNATLSASLSVGQAATIHGPLTVVGDAQLSTLTAAGAATLDSLTVKHATVMDDTLTVTGDATFADIELASLKITGSVEGAAVFNGAVQARSGLELTSGGLTVRDSARILGSVNIEGGGVIRSDTSGANLQIGGGNFYFQWLPNVPNGSNLVFDLAGNGQVGYISSSRTVKENIELLHDDFERILDLEVQSFNYIDAPDTRCIGYIAEEVAALGLHHLVACDPRGKPVAIHYDRIPLYHQELIRNLRSRVDALDQKLARLQTDIDA